MECVRTHWEVRLERATHQGPCAPPQKLDFYLLGGGRWHWYGELFTWKSRHFCELVFCFVIFIPCFGRNQTPILVCRLLRHHPRVTLWTLLHPTWSTNAPDNDSCPLPTADISVVIMPGVVQNMQPLTQCLMTLGGQYCYIKPILFEGSWERLSCPKN